MVEIDAVASDEKSYEEDFRPMYIEEASLRLSHMNSELLTLEEDPQNATLIESLFRDAHTLKTGATMVGFANFARVAHRLEDRLAELQSRRRVVSADLIDELLKVFEALAGFFELGDDSESLSMLALPGLSGMTPPVADATTSIESISASTPEAVMEPAASVSSQPPTEPTAPVVMVTPKSEVSSTQKPFAAQVVSAFTASTPLLPISHLDDALALIDEASAAQIALSQYFPNPDSLPAYRHLTLRLRQLQDAALASRMVMASSLFPIWRRGLRETAQSTKKEVRWESAGEAVLLDRAILDQLRDPLLQIIRNAVVHGIEADRASAGKPAAAKVRVEVKRLGSEVVISISDDGAGINLDRVRAAAIKRDIDPSDLSDKELVDLLFRPGFSTAPALSQVAGRGVGLDIVADTIAKLRGRIQVQTSPAGTEFILTVPATLAVVPCILVQAGHQQFGLPQTSVVALGDYTSSSDLHLGSLLGLSSGEPTATIVLSDAASRLTLAVDALLGKREVIVRPLRGPLPNIDILTGVGLNPDGSILVILDPAALIARSFGHRLSSASA